MRRDAPTSSCPSARDLVQLEPGVDALHRPDGQLGEGDGPGDDCAPRDSDDQRPIAEGARQAGDGHPALFGSPGRISGADGGKQYRHVFVDTEGVADHLTEG
jgi:hypothetical protein